MTGRFSDFIKYSLFFIGTVFVFVLLWSYNYLLFHSAAEIFSIIISSGIFILAWNSRKQTQNLNLYFMGTAYLFIGIIDLVHTLSYKNMGIFPPGDFATQLWISARYMESITLLIFSTDIIEKKIRNYKIIDKGIIVFAFITIGIFASIFYFKIFPVCLVEGKGLTAFKIASEYIICLILLLSVILLVRKKNNYDTTLFRLLIGAISLAILSELAFTLYIDAYGIFNFIGHMLKILSFLLFYQSLIITFIRRPVDILFTKLKKSEQKLISSNQLKTKFFSILAHDLRTPFTGILGFLYLLNSNYYRLTENERRDYIKRCLQGTELAYNLFENLLTWARSQLENMQFNPENVGLNQLIRMNFDLFRTNAVQKDITVTIKLETEYCAWADRDMVNLVLRNLISNAIKFTHNGGKIFVEVQKIKNNLEITVSDTGTGMSREELENLFKPDSHFIRYGTIEEKGAGLGLMLVKEFVEKNNGEIRVKSEPGKGSTFTFTLPAAKQAADMMVYA